MTQIESAHHDLIDTNLDDDVQQCKGTNANSAWNSTT